MSDEELGGWLRAQRAARGWGKAELARRLHAAASAGDGTAPGLASITRSLDGWEGGGRYPRDRWRMVICQVLGVASGDFPAAPDASGAGAVPAVLDGDDPRPWMRVARTWLARIGSGELKPGGPMPGIASVARDCGVSETTAGGAFRYLEGRGVICYVPGAGYRVRGDRPDGTQRHGGMPDAAIRRDWPR